MVTFAMEMICCQERYGPKAGETYPHDQSVEDMSEADKDAGRILTSSSFRRLQGKTQVYPLPSTDFVRNRLTHTIEVAHIGRSIATIIFRDMAELSDEVRAAASQIVYNACLLHDIGNPPFGHSGEYSIREFFDTNEDTIDIVKWAKLGKTSRSDLQHFDGNAQGFRIAARLAGWKRNGGLRLCAGTLTAMMKYAYGSDSPAGQKGKFGFMATEREFALKLFEKCGLKDGDTLYRNPLSLIVEAADDIAYLTSDVQDAHRYKDLPFSRVKGLLLNLSTDEQRPSLKEVTSRMTGEDGEENQINYLRAAAISRLTVAASAILKGAVFTKRDQLPAEKKFDLWTNNFVPDAHKPVAAAEKDIRKVCNELIYRGVKKVSTQVAGGRIIKFVLQTQLVALDEIYRKLHAHLSQNPEGDEAAKAELGHGLPFNRHVEHAVKSVDKLASRESAQIFWGMPAMSRDIVAELLIKSLRPDNEAGPLPVDDPGICYELIQISLDFVAGTTDRYLAEYSKSLSGPTIS